MNRVRNKLSDLARYHRESMFVPDGEKVSSGGQEEGRALERSFDLAMAAAGCAQDACSALQSMASGSHEIADNWLAIAVLASELQRYADTIPDAYDLAKIGHLGPIYRQITR
jgi:hypothetical protein